MRISAVQYLIDIIRGKRSLGSFSSCGRNFRLYLYNYWISYFPSYNVRHWYLKKCLGIKIGKGSFVHLGCYFNGGENIEIGNDTVIGRNVDISGSVKIGNHCSITAHTVVQSASHHKDSENFAGFVEKIIIEDYVWIGNMSMILPGITIKKGAIVGAHSTVSKNVDECMIVAGCPAKIIGKRSENACKYILNYQLIFN